MSGEEGLIVAFRPVRKTNKAIKIKGIGRYKSQQRSQELNKPLLPKLPRSNNPSPEPKNPTLNELPAIVCCSSKDIDIFSKQQKQFKSYRNKE